jgi:selenocysteine lyase/cysteine desulfurase
MSELWRWPATELAAAIRDGAVRVSFHLYNSASDVEALVAALRG